MNRVIPFSLLISALILSGCETPSKAPTLQTLNAPESFNYAPNNPVQTPVGAWWQHFNDPVLVNLIEQGLNNAPDIKIAQANLEKSAAIAQQAHADRGPMIGAQGGGNIGFARSKNPLSEEIQETLSTLGNTPQGNHLDTNFRQYNAAVTGQWDIDIFGAKAAQSAAADAAYLGEEERLHAAQTLLAASIAEHFFNARYSEQVKRIDSENLATLQRLANYVQGRFSAGQASQYNLDDINSNIHALQGKIATLDAERGTEVAQIAALIGVPYQQFHLKTTTQNIFAELPSIPSGYYPQDIITRRPDIRARQAAIMAYAAKRRVAVTDFYPKFTLDFALAQGHLHLGGDLSHSFTGQGGLLGIDIQLPIFTNGRLKANLAQADAALKGAVASYDKTLLNALAEVDSCYHLASSLKTQNSYLNQAKQSANQKKAHAQSLFQLGEFTLDKALNAQMDALNAQENLLNSERTQALNLVKLYTALGGGWQHHS